MLTQPSSFQLRATALRVALPLTTSCALTWDDRKLFVRAVSPEESLNLQGLQDPNRLVECLKRSPVELVKLDSDLSPEVLLRWVEACGQAKKACYVARASDPLEKPPSSPIDYVAFSVKRSAHCAIAGVMAAVLFPVLFASMPTFRLNRRWAVGARGQILDVLLVDELQTVSSAVIAFMVETLARLLNVAQGKMLLNDPMPQSVEACFGL